MKNNAIVILCISITILTSCSFLYEKIESSGELVNENISLADIEGISVSDGFEIEIKNSSLAKIEIETDKNYRQYINITSDKNLLRIYKSEDVIFSDNSLTTIIVFKDTLKTLDLSGGSSVSADMIAGDIISLSLSGGSELKASISPADYEISLSGGSVASLVGQGYGLQLEASGGSELEADDATFARVEATLTGGSQANFTVTDSLTATASGGSELYYSGNPKHITQTSNGGSVIERD